MFQRWAAYCHLTNCSEVSSCSTGLSFLYAEKWDNRLRLWYNGAVVGPCLLYVVVSVIHLVFLVSSCLLKCWKTTVLNGPVSSRVAENAPDGRSGFVVGWVYRATLCSSIFLCLSYVATLIWGAVSAAKEQWHRFVIVELASFVQVCAWYTISSHIASARTEKLGSYPQLLRVWWVFSFFSAVLTFAAGCFRFTRHEVLQLDAWVDILALPPCAFICIVAVWGKTGLRVLHDTNNGIYEPLLSEGLEKIIPCQKVTEYATASFYSLLTLSWLDGLFAVGYKKPLELGDIPRLAEEDCAAYASAEFRNLWNELEDKRLVKCLSIWLWRKALVNAGFAGLYTFASYVGPYLIEDFVEYLGGRRRFRHEGYVLVLVFSLAKIIETIVQRQWYFGSQQLGLRVTAALSAVIYNKGLCLSNQSRRSHTTGEIVNYVSVDVKRVDDFSWYVQEVWLLPLQILLALFILYKNLGAAAFATLGATALTMLANLPLTAVLERFQNKIMKAKDARMRTTSEVLRSMRILKLQAWEMKFLRKVEGLRKVESRWLRKFLYAQAAVTAFFWTTPALVGVATFSTCLLIGTPLTAGRVLSALATFKVLQDPIYVIPDLVSMLAEVKVSLQRIQKFLLEQEIDPDAVDHAMAANGDGTIAIEVHHACFSWDSCPEKPALTIELLQILKGSKVAVCGPVGSGKSSLISCILGDLPKLSGSVHVAGSTAYVAQTAWIQSGKVQENILFGKPMDRTKYERVLSACSLSKDLQLFSHGDQTEIGERGINLSGGQKQRIQLARALYQDADIYLLDDPFSAVDAHTGSHLFQGCILELLKSKTVLYVTHQVEFLPPADNILVVEDGLIVEAGGFDDLLHSGTNFCKLIQVHKKALELVETTERPSTLEGNLERPAERVHDGNKAYMQGEDIKPEPMEAPGDPKGMQQIVQEEERETGKVSAKVYWLLVTAVHGGALVPVLLLCQALFQSFQIASNYWMAWAIPVNLDEPPKVSNIDLFGVYLGLATASSLSVLIRALLLAFISLETGQKFFRNMLQSVFRAPMSFFDATPAGRILSRASTDQSSLDLDVCNRFAGLAYNLIQFAAIVVVMSQTAWEVVLFFIPIIGISIWLQKYYIASARELSRLVGIRRSPVIHHFSESISGVATIRGFGQESRFINTNLQLIDCYCRPLFYNFAAMEWLCLRLNVLSSAIFMFLLMLLVSLPVGTFDASIAGLAVTYSLNISFLQYAIIWNLCNLENKIISVERIQQYCHIPSEAPLLMESCHVPPHWPWAGTIALENLQVRYAPHLPMVLRGITCTFPGGQKIGVVGRTGSGKSTLIQVLFRIVEPVAGTLVIDGVDVSQLGLHDLRAKLSIIPQDPTLFEGTVRSNLDPLEEYTDEEIWEALEKSQLGNVIRAKEEKLDATVCENGENWSVGQRQLVCLGRALLKRTRILVLDEATASVDTETDGVIQDTIRAEFRDCTVITIAHRIPTVIDSDRVLLLSDGRVAEYESPGLLLKDRSSLFARLVSEYTQRSGNTALQ